VWLAECSSVEAACTLAILLAEERVYDRTRIFATAANETVLHEAREGGFAPELFSGYEENYRRGGGRRSLADYCFEERGRMFFMPELLRNITWAQYNLATDASFNEFELIVCRRALADFGPALRRRVLQLFRDSLPLFGMLSIDETSELDAAPFDAHFKAMCAENGLYRRVT
jgi:chemotaxis protein methyltransferase CheR